jgi:hypothetical protein
VEKIFVLRAGTWEASGCFRLERPAVPFDRPVPVRFFMKCRCCYCTDRPTQFRLAWTLGLKGPNCSFGRTRGGQSCPKPSRCGGDNQRLLYSTLETRGPFAPGWSSFEMSQRCPAEGLNEIAPM